MTYFELKGRIPALMFPQIITIQPDRGLIENRLKVKAQMRIFDLFWNRDGLSVPRYTFVLQIFAHHIPGMRYLYGCPL